MKQKQKYFKSNNNKNWVGNFTSCPECDSKEVYSTEKDVNSYDYNGELDEMFVQIECKKCFFTWTM